MPCPIFLLCWITQPLLTGFKVFEREWQGRPPVPSLSTSPSLSSFIRKQSSEIQSFHTYSMWEMGEEDEGAVIQGVYINFKGKCSKIKIVNERIVQRGRGR